jgi:hypothetical protein
MLTPRAVIEHIFTSTNPDTGSQPPAEVAWVVFREGSVYTGQPAGDLGAEASVEQVAEAARAALRSDVSRDFAVSRLSSWYPDDQVWFITFGGEVANVVIGGDSEVGAGVIGRAGRDLDRESLDVVAVRTFTGETQLFDA